MNREEAMRELLKCRAEINSAIDECNATVDRELWKGYEKMLVLSEEYEMQADDYTARAGSNWKMQATCRAYRVAAQSLREMASDFTQIIETRELLPRV